MNQICIALIVVRVIYPAMDRRRFIGGMVGVTLSAGLAGCSSDGGVGDILEGNVGSEGSEDNAEKEKPEGGDDKGGPFLGEASSYILSETEVSESLPGTFELDDTREPNINPVGLESVQINIYRDSDEFEMAEIVVAVHESADNAETIMSDFRSEAVAPREQDVGDNAFSPSRGSNETLYVQKSNIFIQIESTLHISNLRALAETQINKITS